LRSWRHLAQGFYDTARGAAVDRFGRSGNAVTRRAGFTGNFERQRCTQQQAIPVRALIFTAQHGAERLRVVPRVAPA
jgi:hypothetical protein